VALVDIALTIFLNKKIAQIEQLVSARDGYYLRVKFSFFNVFSGITMKGLECGRQGEVFFAAKRLDFGFDLLSLLKKKILIKNIRVRKPQLFANKMAEISSLGNDVLAHMDKSVGFYETVYFQVEDSWLDDAFFLDMKGYLSLVKGNLFISRGVVTLKKIRLAAFSDVDFFHGSSFYKPFDYIFEGELKDMDFIVSRFEVSNPTLKFAGKGRIQGVAADARAVFDVNFLNILLDDFPSINSDRLQSRGVVDAILKVSGPLSDIKALLSLKISNGRFAFFDSLFLNKVNGNAVITQDHLIGQNFSLNINGIPFVADFAATQQDYPHLLLHLFSVYKVGDLSAMVLNFSSDWVEGELAGDVRMRIRYTSKDTSNTMDFHLSDFHLGYEDDLFINARNLDAKLAVEPIASKEPSGKIFSRDLALQHLFCVVRRQEDGFVLEHMKATIYGGTLEGAIEFVPEANQLDIKGEAHLREVDLSDFFTESKDNAYSVSGKLDADLRFDNSLADMFKGQLFVVDGTIAQHPLLNAVSDFLGVPSLKKVTFKDLSMFYSGGRGEYTSQVKLQSPDVNFFLTGKITSYDKMDGVLSVSLATQLLNESKQFKKILAYIKHEEPYVIFPFKISSYIHSPRVLWLKNEFKEKLQNLLPERNKRFLQRQVNSVVEKIEGE
jgi:hypothetical protein